MTIAAQAGLVGHIEVGSNVVVGAQSGVIGNVEAGAHVVGTPAIDGTLAKRYHLVFPHLPKMRSTLRKLEKRVQELEAKLGIPGEPDKA